MALIKCPECQTAVFYKAAACPKCGCPQTEWITNPQIHIGKKRYFTMGSWGGDPIAWQLIATGQSTALAISVYALDCAQFNGGMAEDAAWETSNLKSWLETVFLPEAFTDTEQSAILEVTCLSAGEARKFLGDESNRICEATPYAQKKGVHSSLVSDTCSWWLRTPSKKQDSFSPHALTVNRKGEIDDEGCSVSRYGVAVRPAIWLDGKAFIEGGFGDCTSAAKPERPGSHENPADEGKTPSERLASITTGQWAGVLLPPIVLLGILVLLSNPDFVAQTGFVNAIKWLILIVVVGFPILLFR